MYKGSIRIDLSYSLPITHGFVKAYILDKGGSLKEVRLFPKSRTSLLVNYRVESVGAVCNRTFAGSRSVTNRTYCTVQSKISSIGDSVNPKF
jgi:hypothetical protein